MHFTHKNIALIIIAILIVGGAFGFAEYRNSQAKKLVYDAPDMQAIADALTPELENRDSDEDGLKDWEEGLLGTDSHKADSDGDGTSDGKEAAAGRNPLVKGPNDKASETAKNGIAINTTLTPTDQVARDFFARYMELNQAGLAEDKSSQLALIEDVIKNGIVLSKPKQFTTKDVVVGKDDSKEAILKYGNDLGAIFIKYHNPKARNEMAILKESLEREDPDLLKEIIPIAASYKNMLTAILKLPVPPTLSVNHVDLINGLSILSFVAESLLKVENDTLSGIQGTSVYLTGFNTMNLAFNRLKSAFAAHSIVYASTEPGSFFVPQQ